MPVREGVCVCTVRRVSTPTLESACFLVSMDEF